VVGVDIFKDFIDRSNRVTKEFGSKVSFKHINLLEDNFNTRFDFVHSGVAFKESEV